MISYVFVLVLGVASLFSCCTVSCLRGIDLEQRVTGHLELAASANQPGLAVAELRAAVTGMNADIAACDEPHRCYTSVLWKTPAEDVGFWKANIIATIADLEALPPDADHLVVSNVLLKVRDTLTEQGNGGTRLVGPTGLCKYPHNGAFALWALCSALAVVV